MEAPLDVLAIAAHPDDAELNAGGTLCLLAQQGFRTGILDLTCGELGTRGSPELRKKEAARASEILGLAYRHNLGLPDGGIEASHDHRKKLISELRRTRPRVVLLHPTECRHPDHERAARLTLEACFYSGLVKLPDDQGGAVAPWRPHHMMHFGDILPMEPSFVVDVSDTWDQRMRALGAYESQFFGQGSSDPETFISSSSFLEWVEAHARSLGFSIGAKYGEGFKYRGMLRVAKPLDLLFGN